MANIGNLVDRTFREYLEPMDDLVSYTTLSTGVNDSVTSIVFDGDLLSIEEEDTLDKGTIIEINQELMICTDLNAVTNTITVKRGMKGTTAAAHTAGDLIKISPPFPRKVVFDVVKVCPAAVITISPVDGVYTMLVTGFGKAPTLLVTCPDTYV